MKAIVEIAGFQHKISEKAIIKVPKLQGKEGDKVSFPILMLFSEGGTASGGDEPQAQIGHPYVKGALCEAKILGFGRYPKIVVYKYKSKKNYRRKKGHRQWYTTLLIDKILSGAESPEKTNFFT